jgi:hypothetical protein
MIPLERCLTCWKLPHTQQAEASCCSKRIKAINICLPGLEIILEVFKGIPLGTTVTMASMMWQGSLSLSIILKYVLLLAMSEALPQGGKSDARS